MRRNSFWNEFDFVLKDHKSPQLRRLGSGPFQAEVKLGKRKPFVCVSSKVAPEKYQRTFPNWQDANSAETEVSRKIWLPNFAFGSSLPAEKKSEADIDISQHG